MPPPLSAGQPSGRTAAPITRPGQGRGTVLIAVLVALVVLQLVIVGAVLLGGRSSDLTARRTEGMRAYYAAEGAAQIALREFILDNDESGDGAAGTLAARPLGPATVSVTRSEAGDLTTLTAAAACGQAARTITATFRRGTSGSSGGSSGLKAEVWILGSAPTALSSVPWATAAAYVGVVPRLYFPNQSSTTPRFPGQPSSRFACRFSGTIEIPEAGTWTFTTESSDGSALYVDGVRVVNNDGSHGMSSQSGSIELSEGVHDFEVRWFKNAGNNGLIASWRGPSMGVAEIIPESALSTDASMPPLAAHGSIYLYGDDTDTSLLVDAFDSTAGPYGGSNVLTDAAVVVTNSTAAQDFRLSGKALLSGDAIVGPGGTPDSVIVTWGASTISGGQSAAAQRTAIFTAYPPPAMPVSAGWIAYWSGTHTISGNARYAGLTIGGTSVVNVTADAVVQVDNHVSIQDTAQLNLLNGASLTIYVGTAFNAYTSAQVNANTADPSRLRIFMYGTGNLQITEASRLYAHVSNPGGQLLVYPGTNITDSFTGRFAGASVQATEKARLHLDLSAGASGSGGSGGGGRVPFEMASWSFGP